MCMEKLLGSGALMFHGHTCMGLAWEPYIQLTRMLNNLKTKGKSRICVENIFNLYIAPGSSLCLNLFWILTAEFRIPELLLIC